jgi:hypothetical protein
MSLLDDHLEQVAGAHGLVDAEGNAERFGLLEGAFEVLSTRIGKIGVA